MKKYLEKERDIGTVYDTVDPRVATRETDELTRKIKPSTIANWQDASKALHDAPSPKGKVLHFGGWLNIVEPGQNLKANVTTIEYDTFDSDDTSDKNSFIESISSLQEQDVPQIEGELLI